MNPQEATPFALLANDFHVGKHNIPEFEKNWDEMLDVAKYYGVKYILIGGDMFESSAGQTLDVLKSFRTALQRAAVIEDFELIIADGNHDKTDKNSYNSYCNIFGGCDKNVNFVLSDFRIDIPKSDVSIYLLSYFKENGRFMDYYNKVVKQLNPDCYNILYCHQGISGGLSTIRDGELPTDIFKPFDVVLAGHYHNRKQIPDTNIEYIGASRQHDFGEDPEKGYTILYTDGTYDFVQNEVNRRFIVEECDWDGLEAMKEKLASRTEAHKAMESVKLIINCTEAQRKLLDREELAKYGITKIEARGPENLKKVEQADFKTKYDKAGIKEEYRSFCQDQGVETEELNMGMQYLDKIEETICGI